MKFETFESTYLKENKKLRLILGGSLLMLSLNTFLILGNKNYFVLKNSNLIATRPLLTWACEEAFQSIASGNPIKDLIEDSILNELRKNEFKVSSDEILNVLSLKPNVCRIIVKGEGRVRSFVVSFKESSGNPFYYKLSEINESELNPIELKILKENK